MSIISSDNVISLWSMNELGGTRADELSGYTATDNNTVTSIAGQIGNAAVFVEAQSEWLSVPSNSDLQTGNVDWAYNFWFFLTGSAVHVLLSKFNQSAGNDREFHITRTDTSGGTISFVTYSTTGVAGSLQVGHTDTDSWHMMSMWHDASESKQYISIDDQATPSVAALTKDVRTTDADLRVGAFDSTPTIQFLDGYIDQLIFAKRIFTAAEITLLFNGGDGLKDPFADASEGVFVGAGKLPGYTNVGRSF